MKVEDLLNKKPYTYRKCKEQSFLMGLGSVKDFEILHDGLPIRRLVMAESDVSEITKLLNCSFINGVTQSILRSDEIKKSEIKKSKKQSDIKNDDVVFNFLKKALDENSKLTKLEDLKNLVKIDDEYHISIYNLVKLGYIPNKGCLVKVLDVPKGDPDFWLSSGDVKNYSNRRVCINSITNSSYIWTSPFATELGKRLDHIKSTFISINSKTVTTIEPELTDNNQNNQGKIDESFNFSMGI